MILVKLPFDHVVITLIHVVITLYLYFLFSRFTLGSKAA